MTKLSPAAIVLCSLLNLAAAFVNPALASVVYTEDFNAGDGGWFSSNTAYMASGGVAGSGFLQGTRQDSAPQFATGSGNARAYTTGNLESIYGNLIQFSFYGRVFQGANISH